MILKTLLVWDWTVFVALAVVALAAAGIYFKIHYDYWKRRGFPEPSFKPMPFIGHMTSLIFSRDSFIDTFDDIYKCAGDKPFVGYYHGTQPSVFIRDPELIKHILVKDFHAFVDRSFSLDEDFDPLNAKGLVNLKGQRWKEMRARLSPTFTSGRMKSMFPLMLACGEELNESLSQSIEKSGGEAILEAKDLMAGYAVDVIATCAFGIRCDALKNPETSEFRRMGSAVTRSSFKGFITLMLFILSPKLLKWTGLKVTDDRVSLFFRTLVKDMVEQREKAIDEMEKSGKITKSFGDFIYHLVMLKKRGLHFKNENDEEEDQVEGDHGGEYTKLKEEPSWANIDDDDLTAQVMLFFLAGFEPTSSLLSFALFELSVSERGKTIQEDLREEVERVMEEDGGKITYAGLQRMHLLDRVIRETLRRYSPAGLLNRKAVQPYKIPGTDLVIEEGTQIFIPTQSIQLDEKYFPNPKLFDPDRFLPENKEKMKQFSYLPFGDGPRFCIGERFAQMQAKLGLASVMSQFEFELCHEKTEVPIKFKKISFALAARKGIWLKSRQRREKK